MTNTNTTTVSVEHPDGTLPLCVYMQAKEYGDPVLEECWLDTPDVTPLPPNGNAELTATVQSTVDEYMRASELSKYVRLRHRVVLTADDYAPVTVNGTQRVLVEHLGQRGDGWVTRAEELLDAGETREYEVSASRRIAVSFEPSLSEDVTVHVTSTSDIPVEVVHQSLGHRVVRPSKWSLPESIGVVAPGSRKLVQLDAATRILIDSGAETAVLAFGNPNPSRALRLLKMVTGGKVEHVRDIEPAGFGTVNSGLVAVDANSIAIVETAPAPRWWTGRVEAA
jgi:hypothetical protein